MITQNIAKNLSLHSDQVKASLDAIPTWIAVDLPQHALEALVLSITKHSEGVYNDGYRMGKKNKDG